MRRETLSATTRIPGETNARRRNARGRRGTRRQRPDLLILEERALLAGIVATGAGPGQPPVVDVYDAGTGKLLYDFQPYPASFRGGVQVAVGDVTGKGAPDIITVNGAGALPTAEIFSGVTGALLAKFPVASAAYRGPVSVATGDVTGNGQADIVVSYGQGQPWVSVYSPTGTPLGSFLAYGKNLRGGVRVAVGDLNQSGHADIATVNAAGVPEVKVFDPATVSTLADYKASFYAPRGGASIAVGNFTGTGAPDLVIAQASPPGLARGAEVAVFPGVASSPIASFTIAGRGYANGAGVAAVDSSNSGTDDIALAPASGGSAVVLNSAGIGATLDGTPTVLYSVPSTPGGSLAATSSLTEAATPGFGGTPNAPLPAALTPLQRLGYYDKSTGQFVTVNPDDSRLAGKDVYVIVHGWAPGYLNWVNAAAAKGQTLLWWNTFPTQLGYDPTISGGLSPDSNFLLDGNTVNGVVVNPTGLAETLAWMDPNAAVLAYSWIDESATATSSLGIPENASVAGARTELNGERLALGLSQAIGPDFTGKLQIIGHSYGSKVATVAAGALTQASPIHVNQLTILDSPEDNGSTLGETVAGDGAANYNWYFLQNLTVNRADSNGTFVDNYISYFDEPYSQIAYTPSNLGNVVDVKLNPLVYSFDDPGDKHSYSAQWYAGSAWPNITYGAKVGALWSPLISGNSGPSNPPASLSPGYKQTWTSAQQSTQFVLASASLPSPTPTFNPITFQNSGGSGVSVSNSGPGASVTLMQQGGTSVSYAGTFKTSNSFFGDHGIQGVTFAYNFANYAPGDELTITIDSYIGNTYVGFVMEPVDLLSPSGLGTISIADPNGDIKHTLTFTLTSAPGNSTSSVTVSKLQQLSY